MITCQGAQQDFPESRFLKPGLQVCNSLCPPLHPHLTFRAADNESWLWDGGGNKNQRLSKHCPGRSRGVVGRGGAPGTSLDQAVELGDPWGGAGLPLPWTELWGAEVSPPSSNPYNQ